MTNCCGPRAHDLKRMLALLLIIISLLGMIPISAAAAEPHQGGLEVSRYDALGEYRSASVGNVAHMHYIYVKPDDGAESIGFCMKYGAGLPKGKHWTFDRMVSPGSESYCIWLDNYYALVEFNNVSSGGTPSRTTHNAFTQALLWESLLNPGKYDPLLHISSPDVLANKSDPVVEGLLHDAAVAMTDAIKPNLTGAARDAQIASYTDNARGKVNGWLFGNITHRDYYIYNPSNTSWQPLITTYGTNQNRHAWIKVRKIDDSGTPLAGAVFGIWKHPNSSCQGTPDYTLTTEADGWGYLDVRLDADIQTFYINEYTAPAGFKKIDRCKSFNLSKDSAQTKDQAVEVYGEAIEDPTEVTGPGGPGGPGDGVVQKIDAKTKKGLPGAQFCFSDGVHKAYFSTGSDGNIQMQWTDRHQPNYLAPGDYTVWEETPPTGYTCTSEKQNITLRYNGGVATHTGPLIFQDYPLKKLTIKKEDEAGGPLAGATFSISRDGKLLGEFTTQADGTINYTGAGGKGVEDGTYTIIEVTPPPGCVPPLDRMRVIEIDSQELHDADPATVTFRNYNYPDFMIRKVDRGSEQGLPGAVFEVKIDGGDAFRVGPTGPNGTLIIDYATYKQFIPQASLSRDTWTVEAREVVAPDGYLIDDDDWQTIEVKAGEKAAPFVFTDTAYPKIVIIKKDFETGDRLANARFEITIDGHKFGPLNTNADGEIVIDYETYRDFLVGKDWDGWQVVVTEIDAPNKYNLDDQDDRNATSGKHQTKIGTLTYGQSRLEFEFEDTHYRNIRVTKRDQQTGWTLPGATFTLRSLKLDDNRLAAVSREGKTNQSGQILFEDLPNGVYRITETVPPTGYQLPEPNYQDITVTSGSDRTIEVEFLDRPKEGILIRKVDAVTGLPVKGVTFSVQFFGETTAPDGNTNDAREYVTNEDGTIYIPDRATGWYQIIETAVPDGYVLDPQPHMLHVPNTHEPVTVTYENYQDTQLIVVKKDAQTGLPLSGAVFEVTTAGGDHVATIETGPNGCATLEGMGPGAYVVREIEAPDGHLIDPLPQTFEIVRGQTQPVVRVFSNNNKTNLYLRKEDAQTHIGVEGAVFEVRHTNGELVLGRWVTGEDGLVGLLDLDPGSYTVKEIEAPQGYILDSTPQTVYLDAGVTHTLVFRNDKPGGIAILKQDAFSGLPLAHAKFHLYTEDDRLLGTYETGLDGYARISDLDPGYYFVQESEAPEGYLLDQTKHKVYVEQFKVTLLSLRDYEKSGLTIMKVDSASKIPLAGAQFGVYDMKGSTLGLITTNKDGVAQLTGIEPGWYRVKEAKAPDGYILDEEEHLVEIKDGVPASLTVSNVRQTGITVHKVDAATQEPLHGAQFELRTADGKLVGNYATDASGAFVTTNVAPGVYFLVETKAPDGYAIDTKETKVVVTEGEYPIVTIPDHKGTSIQIMKTDAVTGAYLAGAEFEVWSLDETRLLGTYVTDKTGIVYTDVLPAGDYIVKESKAPEGYLPDSEHHHVNVGYDHPTILKVADQPMTGLTIAKVSTVDDTPLMGAKFAVRTAEGDPIGEFTTDTTGTVSVPIQEPGVYYVQEVEEPDGYLLNDEVFRVEIQAGKMVPLVVEDDPACELVIFKGDSGSKRGVAGAVFKVETADGAFIGTYTTDVQGEALVRPVHPGHYIVTEMSAPEGYTVSETPKTITVLPGQINRVEFMDAAKGALVVRLEDQKDGHKLENGRFQLFFAETGKLAGEGVTDDSGSIVWGDLLPGRYIIKQTYAPDGYGIVDAEKDGIVVSGDTTVVVFKDYTAGLVVEKTDRLTGQTLSGARFQVTRSTDNVVIGEYVTGEDGLALVSGLTEGMYYVEELIAPTGYAIDEGAKLVHVKPGTEAHVMFSDTPNAGITVQTLDGDTKKPLAGVIVELHQQNGGLIDTYTSDGTGTIQSEKLAAGWYVLKVIKAPEGYELPSPAEQAVEIKGGQPVTVKFELSSHGILQILSLSDKEEGLPGMKVEIRKQGGELVGSYATGANGLLTVPDLLPGWYVIAETTAPDGYSIVTEESQTVQVTANRTAIVKFYHSKTFGLQIRTSVKQTGAVVAGAKYQISKLDGVTIGVYTSDPAGLIYASLEPGWYVVKMTELPDGYKGYGLCASRNVEVKAGAPTTIEFQLSQMSSIRVKFVDGSTEKPIYGVKVLLKRQDGTIVDQYTSNNEGYIALKDSILDGTYILEQTYVPGGYTIDPVPKTIQVLNGETTEVVWRLFTQGGQIQVHLTSAAYHPLLDLKAGSNLAGAVFEIYDPFTYVVLATATTDSYGVAATGALPIGRYIIREKTAPNYFAAVDHNGEVKETEVYIKIDNDVVRVEYQNSPLDIKASHKIEGNRAVAAGQFMKHVFKAVNNDSTSRLDNFYWTVTIPTDAMRAGTLYTGIWSSDIYYSISYKTNMNDWRGLASGLSSATAKQFDLSSLSMGVNGGEYVTQVRFEFGTVPAGFKPTTAPVFYDYVLPGLPNGYKIIMRSECGGKYGESWATATALWTTVISNIGTPANNAAIPSSLPKTGY